MKLIYLAAAISWTTLSCSTGDRQESRSQSVKSEVQQPKEELWGINEDEIFLRKEPKQKGEKIVNEKATEAIGKTHYISVDKSCKVKILERENGWSKIQVVEPDWLQYTHIGWLEDEHLASFDQINPKRNILVKLSAFSNVETLRANLSGNGIGALRPWKYVDGLDWQSLTDYFEIGREANQYGLRNNLAYYLTSPEEGFVESLQLVLNINSTDEREFAHEKMKEMIRKTFQSIDQPVPDGLLKSVDKESKFSSTSDVMLVTLKPEKSKIMTLILEIRTM